MTEREVAVRFYRELLDLAVAADDRDSYERLLFDLFDRGAEEGAEAWRRQRAEWVELELATQRRLFDEAVRLSESRGRRVDELKRELADAQQRADDMEAQLVSALEQGQREVAALEQQLAEARAENEEHRLRLVDARVAS